MTKLIDSDLRRDMDQLLEAWAAAIVANDAGRIDAFAEEDWALVGTGGVMTRQGFLDLVASGQLTHEEMNFEILDLWNRGDLVVVLAHGTNRGHWQGQPFAEDEYVTEIFARHADGWRCVVSTLTPRMRS